MVDTIDLVLLIVESIFLVLNGMMIAFILSQRSRKNSAYSSSFYVMFLLISVVDILYILNNDFGVKAPKQAQFRDFFEADTYIATVFYFLSAYLSAFEISGHMLISVNRYFTIRNSAIQVSTWSSRTTNLVYCLMFLIPIPTTAYRLFTPARYTYSATGAAGLSYKDPTVSKVVSYANIGFYIFNVLPSLVFTVLSVANYRSFTGSKYEVTLTEKRELKLILHSVVMATLLVGRFAYQVTLLLGSYWQSYQLLAVAQLFFPIVASVYSLVGTPLLLIVSRPVRDDFMVFYRIYPGKQLGKTVSGSDDGINIY